MSMNPGATTMPRASIGALGGRARQISDGRDAPMPDADIAGIPGRARAVDDVAVPDHDVIRIIRRKKKQRRQ